MAALSTHSTSFPEALAGQQHQETTTTVSGLDDTFPRYTSEVPTCQVDRREEADEAQDGSSGRAAEETSDTQSDKIRVLRVVG